MPSSLGAQFDLTIRNASSTQYTLKVMTVVAVILTPIVLLYQGWTYWVFRKRVSSSQIAYPERGALDVVSHNLPK
jgi:cytochrome d ubiquinol oxidase subunit II